MTPVPSTPDQLVNVWTTAGLPSNTTFVVLRDDEIPREERLNIRPGSKMTMLEINGQVRLLPVLPPAAYRGIARGLKDTSIQDEPDRF